MHTSITTDPRGARCSDAATGAVDAPPASGGQPLFPPKDADAAARRRWLASSPWPEVVFAAAI